jgi:molybdopterin molybdotransferase
MSSLLSVEEVQKYILARTRPLLREQVTLQDARHRVAACNIVTDVAIPSFNNSAVDGYAVRWIDLIDATPTSPVVLSEHGAVMAGDGAD